MIVDADSGELAPQAEHVFGDIWSRAYWSPDGTQVVLAVGEQRNREI